MAVRPPKILAVVSSVDLGHRYGCTPAWWQLWKGLYEADVDLIVTPYRGRAIEAPWWRVEPNPCYREGESFDALRRSVARVRGDTLLRRDEESPGESLADRAAREAILKWVNPRWERHLTRILERERDVDAVVVFTVPMAHLVGIPTALRERFGIPVVFYDADVPMSLPEFGGMDTGFNPYLGADPSEYDLVLSNSEGGIPRLLELGAKRADHLFWGADTELFRPLPLDKEHDVVFYGYGDKFRRDWLRDMVGLPSNRLQDVDFVVAGGDFQGELGRAARAWLDAGQRARPHDLAVPDQPQHRQASARIGLRVVDEPYLRDGRRRCLHRLESLQRDRPLVRAGARASRGREHGAGRAGVPRSAGGPGPGGRAGTSGAGAGSRRAHLWASRPPVARSRRHRLASGLVTPGRTIAVVPARNEEGAIGGVVDEIRAFDPSFDVVVIDDDSTDATAAVAAAHGAAVLRLPYNLGIGGAVQTGFKYAHERGYAVAVRLDGDGQHDASQIGSLLGPLLRDEADIVTGSRFAGGSSDYQRPARPA